MLPSMTPVSSSNVEAVGYDDAAGDLYVSFLSGTTYVYYGVDRSHYEALLAASSVGSYLATHIKPYYRYARL